MRVALVHDWLTGMRGGEKVLEALLDLFPDAEIFTLLHLPGSVSAKIEARPIHTSFVQRFPGLRWRYRYYLPFFPAAIERLDLRGFDLVLSTSHCAAKGVRPPPRARHLCYCLTPMRYVWDMYDAYFGAGRARPWVRGGMAVLAPWLRRWDVASAARVDAFVACSEHVRERVARIYGREGAVVYPPVAVERFRAAPVREEYYLIVSALVPYKRLDVAVEAFNRLGRRLVIAGEGSEFPRLARLAGPNVTLTGRVSEAEIEDLMGRCRAFVFPGEEDFGIALVEAQAAGAPVIAYGRGGAIESVIGVNGAQPGRPTGLFFGEQTPEALVEAVRRFEPIVFDPADARTNAMRFSHEQFRRGIRAAVRGLVGVG